MKTELVLTEAEVDDLIKMNLNRGLDGMDDSLRIEGARFELHENRLIAHINIMYLERVPAQITAEYLLEWKEPNLFLLPQSLSVKGIGLPLNLLETITIPLDLPTGDLITVQDVKFENDQIKVLFKIKLPF